MSEVKLPPKKVLDRLKSARFYAIADLGYIEKPALVESTLSLLKGGAEVIQLRAKDHSPEDILSMALALRPICHEAGVPFIVNDHADVAIACAADGLHIGQDDGDFSEIRKMVGSKMILGRSTHSPEQAHQAYADGFDYIGFGPLFPTPTKLGRPGIGLSEIATIENSIGQEIPVFCIGGIKRSNLSQVLEAGARRVVIVSDLLTAADPEKASAQVCQALT